MVGATNSGNREVLIGTFVTSPGTACLGAWLAQFLAESTGKQGDGVVPVEREPFGVPSA